MWCCCHAPDSAFSTLLEAFLLKGTSLSFRSRKQHVVAAAIHHKAKNKEPICADLSGDSTSLLEGLLHEETAISLKGGTHMRACKCYWGIHFPQFFASKSTNVRASLRIYGTQIRNCLWVLSFSLERWGGLGTTIGFHGWSRHRIAMPCGKSHFF